MSLLTEAQRLRLLQNGANPDLDHAPVVRMYIPQTRCQWLLSELDPDEVPDRAFGLCDLGMGFPELGYVSLDELQMVSSQLGLALVNDPAFAPRYAMSVYARAARLAQAITLDPNLLALSVSDPSRSRGPNRPPQP